MSVLNKWQSSRKISWVESIELYSVIYINFRHLCQARHFRKWSYSPFFSFLSALLIFWLLKAVNKSDKIILGECKWLVTHWWSTNCSFAFIFHSSVSLLWIQREELFTCFFFLCFFFRAFYSMICSFISSLSFLFYFFYNRMHSQTRMNFSAGIKERSTPGASLCSTLCLESEHDGVKKIHLSHTWQDTEKDPFMLPCQNNQRRLTFIRNRHYAD